MFYYFKMSNGLVFGTMQNGGFEILSGLELIEELYEVKHAMNGGKLLETVTTKTGTWVKIPLDDGYYGQPEYEVRQF